MRLASLTCIFRVGFALLSGTFGGAAGNERGVSETLTHLMFDIVSSSAPWVDSSGMEVV